jgi:hypothetical protein
MILLPGKNKVGILKNPMELKIKIPCNDLIINRG